VWPQLAGEFGIRFGVLWRGLGGEPGQERDFYRWRGPDGREVLIYHLPPDGYEIGAALPADAERLPRAWSRVRSGLVERAATRQIAVFIGADHHAPHPGITELQALLAELEPGNQVRISRLHDFFLAAASEAAGVPVIADELRWSYGYTWTLQGVQGTRAPLKRRHAQAEMALSALADPLVALTLTQGGSDRRALLDHAWRLLLQSEFHDSIAGCTSDSVARQVELRLESAEDLATEVARASVNELIGNDPDRVRDQPDVGESQLVLWNPVPRRRSGVVVADLTWFRRDVLVGPPGDKLPREGSGSQSFHLNAADATLPVQSLGQRRAHERMDSVRHYPDQDEVDQTRVGFETPEVPGLGVTVLGVRTGARTAATRVSVNGRTLANELIEVRLGAGGTIQLTDRRTRQRYPDVLSLESSGDVGDTYTFAAPRKDRVTRSSRRLATRVLARGPLVAAVELGEVLMVPGQTPREGGGMVQVRMILTLYAGSPVLRFSLEIDNQAQDHRLRARMKTSLPGGRAVAGSQFGAAARPPIGAQASRYPRETPVATAPAHRFVARAAKSRGLALLTPGFFEYELEPGGDLLLTVLRAVGQLSRGDLPTRPGHAGWPVPTPAAQCQGRDRLQLAIVPVTQREVESGTRLPHLWEDVFLPIRPVWLRQASPLTIPAVDIRLEGEGLVFSGVKPALEGRAMVLRCYNATAQPTGGIWQLSTPVSAARRARADEHVLHEVRLGEDRRSVPFHAAPHEIVTIVVTFDQSG
jgi:alpha-mannosidase